MGGVFLARRRVGRGVVRAYFVVFADGRMVKNLAERDARGGFSGEAEVEFRERLTILAKAGPSGFEGMRPGGVWYSVTFVSSDTHRRIELSLPLLDEKVSITVEGRVDLEKITSCGWYDASSLINLVQAEA